MSGVQQAISVRFGQVHGLSLRVTLVERLQRLYGVVSAHFDSSDYRNLTVEFWENSLSPITLLDFVKQYGMLATVVGDDSDTNPVEEIHDCRN